MMLAKMEGGALVIGLTKAEVEMSMQKGAMALRHKDYQVVPEGVELVLVFAEDLETLRAIVAQQVTGAVAKARH